ncbi:hypothetical protein ABEB36_001062 [Hypothenemus hampei]|uniref:Uncharacterized protein n=1 Tax=Hypothenemus hampei TaxID=57062 RepID=A0ABD1FDB6_HYPHA
MKSHLYQECGKKKRFECDICHKKYISYVALKSHKSKDCDEPRYQCANCPRNYKHLHHLKSHLKYECNKNPAFGCPVCSKKFHYQFLLNAHLKQPSCRQKIIGLYNLRVRSMYQPHQIRYLESEYSKNQYINLKQRIWIARVLGLTERQIQVWFQNRRRRGTPRACVKCSKQYKFKGNINRHLKYECGKTATFCCPLCDFKCKRFDYLKFHLNSKKHADSHVNSFLL